MTDVRLPLRAIVPFAGGSIGMGIWVTVPGIFLLYFLTDVLAVPPAAAGLALLLPNIADVVLHPWVGRLSDAGLARDGHRRRLLFAGCAVVVSFVALFAGPAGLRGTPAVFWVAAALVAGNLLYSFYQVSYLATPADLGIGYHERTRLMGYRNVVITVGVLVAGVAAPLLTGDDPDVGDYTRMTLLLGAVMLAAMLAGITGVTRLNKAAPAIPASATTHIATAPTITHIATAPAPTTAAPATAPTSATAAPATAPTAATVPPAPISPATSPAVSTATASPATSGHRGGLLAALRDRQFRALTASYLTMAITMNLVLAAMPYFAEYELGRPKLTTALIAAFMTPAVLATPLWVLVARRFGKQRGLLAAQAAFVAGSLVLALGAAASLPVVITAVAVLGVSFAAMQLMPLSMVPDVIAASGGGARAGSYTGLWTAAEATGGALGPYVFSACLAAGGFVASTAGTHTIQSPGALAAVRYGFTLAPAVLMTLAVLLQRRYTLDKTAGTGAMRPDESLLQQ